VRRQALQLKQIEMVVLVVALFPQEVLLEHQ
jgi:hypothetical protein